MRQVTTAIHPAMDQPDTAEFPFPSDKTSSCGSFSSTKWPEISKFQGIFDKTTLSSLKLRCECQHPLIKFKYIKFLFFVNGCRLNLGFRFFEATELDFTILLFYTIALPGDFCPRTSYVCPEIKVLAIPRKANQEKKQKPHS